MLKMRLTKRRDTQAISPELLKEKFSGTQGFKLYVFFYFAKSKYKNSQIYNYTPEKLSKLTGLSPNTIRKYVGELKKINIAYIKGNNLIFKSSKNILNIDRSKKIIIDVLPWTTWKQYFNRILASFIKRNQDQQEWIYSKRAQFKNIKLSQYKLYSKRYKMKYIEDDTIVPMKLNSTRQLAKLLNVNKRTIADWLIRLRDIGYCKLKPNIERIKCYIDESFISGHFFYYKNNAYIHHGTIIRIKTFTNKFSKS